MLVYVLLRTAMLVVAKYCIPIVYHACVLLVRYLYCAVSGQAESRGWYPESGVSGI